MPYWSIFCLYCQGYIADALLECVPASRRRSSSYLCMLGARPGVALACPYCGGLIGFDESGQPCQPSSGWPVFRYGLAELRAKMLADGEPESTHLTEWALRHRFTRPGIRPPLSEYVYAEQAPPDETVP
jgi:hypothetical protein